VSNFPASDPRVNRLADMAAVAAELEHWAAGVGAVAASGVADAPLHFRRGQALTGSPVAGSPFDALEQPATASVVASRHFATVARATAKPTASARGGWVEVVVPVSSGRPRLRVPCPTKPRRAGAEAEVNRVALVEPLEYSGVPAEPRFALEHSATSPLAPAVGAQRRRCCSSLSVVGRRCCWCDGECCHYRAAADRTHRRRECAC
jgi:hypothetical protein